MRRSPTTRQLQVLAAMSDGSTFKRAGWILGIKTQTAKNLAHEAYVRLGVSGRVEAYRVLGWLTVPR